MLAETSLADKAGRLSKDITLLDRKRLGLARAMIVRPSLLLLDEVAAGLTLDEIAQLVKLILRLRESGTAIAIVEHVDNVIRELADRVIELDWGRIIAEGTPEQIAGDERVREIYLGRRTTQTAVVAGDARTSPRAGLENRCSSSPASAHGTMGRRRSATSTFGVHAGELVAVLGANGSGKSTLARLVSGLLKPVRGTVVFDRADISGVAPHVRANLGIAAPEGRRIFTDLTVEENLMIGAYSKHARPSSAQTKNWIAATPEFASAGVRDVAFTFLSYAVLAQAWNLIGGFGGQFSLGNSAFVGFRAYVTAWLLINTSVSPVLAFVVAAIAVIPLACVASFALFRLHGVYLSVGSLAMALAAAGWMANWSATGATQGLNIPFERALPDQGIYALTVALAALSTLAAWYLASSDFGLCVQAVRDDEEAATSVGVATFSTKTAGFALSAAFPSAMGALIALRQISIEPTSLFGIGWTTSMIVMCVVGGIGTIWGPFLGAFVVYFGIEKQLEAYQDVATLITGGRLIAVVRFVPHGLVELAGRARETIRAARSKPRREPANASL